MNDDIASIRDLIAKGIDVNQHTIDGFTYLQICVWRGYEFVKLLIEAGADPNIRDLNGKPSWHEYFWYSMSARTLKYLLEAGAIMNQVEKNEFLLESMGNGDVQKFLLFYSRGAQLPLNPFRYTKGKEITNLVKKVQALGFRKDFVRIAKRVHRLSTFYKHVLGQHFSPDVSRKIINEII